MLYAEELTKSFGGNEVLAGISFSIGDGERVGLVGPNGAGKSTLLRVLAGDDVPDTGRSGHRGGDLEFLRQEPGLDPEHTISEELWEAFPEARTIERELEKIATKIGSGEGDLDTLIAEQGTLFERFDALDGYRIDKRIGRVLAGLRFDPGDATRKCSDFSGGWQMRVALAKVLVHRPPNLVLDEPTNGLDPEGRDEMLDLIDRTGHEFGISIVMSSHLLAEIERVCDSLIVIEAGRLVEVGQIADLTRVTTTILVEVERPASEVASRLASSGFEVSAEGRRLEVSFDPADEDRVREAIVAAVVDAGMPLIRLEQRRRSLEDLFQQTEAPPRTAP